MCQGDEIARLNAELMDKDEAMAIMEDERNQLEDKNVALEKKLFLCKQALESSNQKKADLKKEIADLQESNRQLLVRIGELTNDKK